MPHLVGKINGFPLKAKSFRNIATHELAVPSSKCQRGEFVCLLWNVPNFGPRVVNTRPWRHYPNMGSYLHPNVVKNANFRELFLRVFAYIARRYNSVAEATSLLSSVASLAKNRGRGSINPPPPLFHGGGMTLRVGPRVNTTGGRLYSAWSDRVSGLRCVYKTDITHDGACQAFLLELLESLHRQNIFC